MRQFLYELKNFFRKGDMVLLIMCLSISAFGCLIIASTNNYRGFTRYLVIQIAAIVLGVLVFALVSSIDLEFLSEHRMALTIFSLGLLLLLIPFGTDLNSGNKSWLDLPLIPFYVQPAEICKIFYILITASVMNSHQSNLSSPRSVIHTASFLVLLVGTNMVLSKDAGVSLIFVFIFIGMAFAGGIKIFWFLLGGSGIAVPVPILRTNFMRDDPRKRFEIPMGEDYTVWDLNEEFVVDPEKFVSMGKATPFAGWKLCGQCVLTLCDGKEVYRR
jgi:rod shape determining protein RodA